MNPDYAEDIRQAENHRHGHAYINYDMLRKKYVNRVYEKQADNKKPINAQEAYKKKHQQWMTNKVCQAYVRTSVVIDPVVVLPIHDKSQYNIKFIDRYKLQHEYQSAFKIHIRDYAEKIQQYPLVQKTVNGNLIAFKQVSQIMSKQQNKHIGLQAQNDYQKVKESLQQLALYIDNEMKSSKKEELIHFCSVFCKQIERIIDKQAGSTLFLAEPDIGKLTYAAHPVLQSISCFYAKQSYQKGFKRQKISLETADIIEQFKAWELNIKQAQNIKPRIPNIRMKSHLLKKVAFINLDGYQSEYNLQIARNFSQNLFYVSFPKIDHANTTKNLNFSRRLFKKIMFNTIKFNKNEKEISELSLEQLANYNSEKMAYDPQNYHENIQQLYSQQLDTQQMNKNLFIFPIHLHDFIRQYREKFQAFPQGIQNYQSHFVLFILNNYIRAALENFKADLTIISYSGRIAFQNEHFTQILKLLVYTSDCRIIYFPNNTAATYQASSPKKMEQENQSTYDGFLNDYRINFKTPEYFLKLSKFLKLSSNTANLYEELEEVSLFKKYKNSKIFNYTYRLLHTLSEEYNNVKQTMLAPDDQLLLLDQFYTRQMKKANVFQNLQKYVSPYYFQLYEIVEQLVMNQQKFSDGIMVKEISIQSQEKGKKNNQNKQFKIDIQQYKDLIYQVRSFIQHTENQTQITELFTNFKQENLFENACQQVNDVFHLPLQSPNLGQNQSKNSQLEETQRSNAIKDICIVSFTKGKRQFVKLNKNNEILYERRQPSKAKNIHVLIMNYVGIKDAEPKCYVAYPKINFFLDISKAQIFPINFVGGQITNPYQLRCKWNYTQTEDYLVLYWPSVHDNIKVQLNKLMKTNSQSFILKQIYIAKKFKQGDKICELIFNLVQIDQAVQYLPRYGCSTYEISNKLFIFGGFYQSQHNYLTLQKDITQLNLSEYNPANNSGATIKNLKNQLYDEIFNPKLSKKQKDQYKYNSFVRSRIQYEFYDYQQNQRERKVIMIGGYGQNFIHPFSMLSNYYYQITFDLIQNTVKSVQRKIAYNTVFPINTIRPIKNKGLMFNYLNNFNEIDKNKRYVMRQSYLTTDNYLSLRLAYMFNEGKLQFKQKSFYALSQYSFTKQFEDLANKLGERKFISHQKQEIILKSINGRKQFVFAKQGNTQVALKLYYVSDSEVVLPESSILSIDIKGSTRIFAIVKHEKHTKSKGILTIFNDQISLLNLKQYSTGNEFIKIILKPFTKKLQCNNFNMHCVIICGKYVLIMHGLMLRKVKKQIVEFRIKLKEDDDIKSIDNIKSLQLDDSKPLGQIVSYNECNAFFFNKDGKIQCYNIFSSKKQKYFGIISEEIDIIDQNQWKLKPDRYLFKFCFIDAKGQVLNNVQINEIRYFDDGKTFIEIIIRDQSIKVQLSMQETTVKVNEQVFYAISIQGIVDDSCWKEGFIARKLQKTMQKYDDFDQE